MEIYQSYADYEDMMVLTEKLIYECARRVLGKSEVVYQGETLDLTPPWPRETMISIVQKYAGVDFTEIDDDAGAREAARQAGMELDGKKRWGEILNLFFETFCEEQLRSPIFVVDYPVDISPLSKKNEKDPRLTDRFEALWPAKRWPTLSRSLMTLSISGKDLSGNWPTVRPVMKRPI